MWSILNWPADDLKLIELKPENSSWMLDQGPNAKGTGWGSGIFRRNKVPNLEMLNYS